MNLTLASFMKKNGPEAGDLRLLLNLRFLGLHSLFVFSDLTPNFPQSHLFLETLIRCRSLFPQVSTWVGLAPMSPGFYCYTRPCGPDISNITVSKSRLYDVIIAASCPLQVVYVALSSAVEPGLEYFPVIWLLLSLMITSSVPLCMPTSSFPSARGECF